MADPETAGPHTQEVQSIDQGPETTDVGRGHAEDMGGPPDAQNKWILEETFPYQPKSTCLSGGEGCAHSDPSDHKCDGDCQRVQL